MTTDDFEARMAKALTDLEDTFTIDGERSGVILLIQKPGRPASPVSIIHNSGDGAVAATLRQVVDQMDETARKSWPVTRGGDTLQ